MVKAERCRNPWNGRCTNTDIEVYIIYKNNKLPICRRCWSRIANSNIEWGGQSHNKGSAALKRRGRIGAGAD